MKLPSSLVLALAIGAGILETLNETTLGIHGPFHAVVTYIVIGVGLVGVAPAVGAQLGLDLRQALHLSPALVAGLLAAATAAAGLVQTLSLDATVKGIVLGVIAFIVTVFGPGGEAVAPARKVAAT